MRSAGGGGWYERLGNNSAEDFDWDLVDWGFYQTADIRGREDHVARMRGLPDVTFRQMHVRGLREMIHEGSILMHHGDEVGGRPTEHLGLKWVLHPRTLRRFSGNLVARAENAKK